MRDRLPHQIKMARKRMLRAEELARRESLARMTAEERAAYEDRRGAIRPVGVPPGAKLRGF